MLIWLLQTVRGAVGFSNTEKHPGALRLIFPPRELLVYSMFVLKRKGTISRVMLAVNVESGVKRDRECSKCKQSKNVIRGDET